MISKRTVYLIIGEDETMDNQKKERTILESAIIRNIGHLVIVIMTSLLKTLDNQKKERTILESAIIGNVGHLVIVIITSLLMTFLGQFSSLSFYNVFRSLILVLVFILTLFMWFNIGLSVTKNNKSNIYFKGIITAI